MYILFIKLKGKKLKQKTVNRVCKSNFFSMCSISFPPQTLWQIMLITEIDKYHQKYRTFSKVLRVHNCDEFEPISTII